MSNQASVQLSITPTAERGGGPLAAAPPPPLAAAAGRKPTLLAMDGRRGGVFGAADLIYIYIYMIAK